MTSSTIIGFDLIVILSFLFGLLVLGTAIFSSRVHRQPPWYSLMAPLFIYDIVFMLGMGYQVDTGFPAGLCIWQAILLYSIPGWALVAFGSFIIFFHLELKNHIMAEKDNAAEASLPSKRTRLLLVFMPLLSFVGFLLLNGLTVSLSRERPIATQNSFKLYCIPKTHTGLYVGGVIMGVVMLIWIFVIIRLGVLLRTHYSKLKGRGEAIFHQTLSIYIRVTAISIAGSLVIGLYVSTYATKNMDSIVGSYFLALPSAIIFLVFGTQRDIIKCWAFWRHIPTGRCRFKNENPIIVPFSAQTETTNGANEGRMANWKSIGYNWNDGPQTH